VAMARRVTEIVPGLPVLYISGCSPDEFQRELGEPCIAKPFSGCELADAVGRLFGRGAAGHTGQVVA